LVANDLARSGTYAKYQLVDERVEKMLSKQQRQAASDLLWQHWQQGRRMHGLPEAMRPATRAEGYSIQSLIESRSAKPIFGWKIAATSREGQAHIGVDGPLAGRLPAERVVASGATLPLKTNLMKVAELELAFRLGRDIAPRSRPYTVDEIMNVVDALHVGIEIPDSRFEDFATAGAPQLLADDACADYYVLGPAAPEQWRSLDLSKHKVKGIVAGKYDRDGLGGNVLGDPRVALTWLANELSAIGVSLKAGQVATTGTCLLPLQVASGDEVTGDFGQLGQVSVRLS
jgi:2-keto-4-pentenoate hydratase